MCPRNGESQDVDPGTDDGRAEERSRGQPEQADHHRGAEGEAGGGVRGRTRATAALLQRETGELAGEGAVPALREPWEKLCAFSCGCLWLHEWSPYLSHPTHVVTQHTWSRNKTHIRLSHV